MPPILQKLSGADRRSIGKVNEIVSEVIGILFAYLKDESKIGKTFSMQARAELAAQEIELRPAVIKKLQTLTRTGSPAMKARGRKLLAKLRRFH